jgi:hypothetical protein
VGGQRRVGRQRPVIIGNVGEGRHAVVAGIEAERCRWEPGRHVLGGRDEHRSI